MFLAINEIKYSKLRYSLIIGVMFLVSYLVFFLTGLAYGLAQDNRTAIDKWDADYIMLSSDSDSKLGMSDISMDTFNEVKAENKAVITQTPSIIREYNGNNTDRISISMFGTNRDEFTAPNIIEGRQFKESNEAVADISLKTRYGLKEGDTITLSGDYKLKLVGFTDNSKFSVSPVVYTSLDDLNKIKPSRVTNGSKNTVNAVVIRGNVEDCPNDKLDNIAIQKFINDLPGYSAQVLTFGFMIGFLILIAAIVMGIFIYILTIQKVNIFGVMKAQGISSGYIAASVVAQTFLLTIIGVGLGLVLTYLTSLILPEAVPFQSNLIFFASVSLAMLMIALIGGLLSIKTITKIDPVKAIG